uniref:Uncharacterized protein n=1 Tax=Anguilla anguilla TaxID=7936 RepID=A0A0E9SQN9_ANGAN
MQSYTGVQKESGTACTAWENNKINFLWSSHSFNGNVKMVLIGSSTVTCSQKL